MALLENAHKPELQKAIGKRGRDGQEESMKPSEAKTWADELEFLLSDEMFPEGSIMQMNPDIMRDGIRIMRQLEEELAKYKEHLEPQMIQIRLREQSERNQPRYYSLTELE